MEALARRLTHGLSNPQRPTLCPACALSLFSLHLTGARGATVKLLRQQHHAFLTAIMNFFTVERHPDDLEALSTSMRLTAAHCPHNAIHAVALGQDCADRAVVSLWTIILFCLSESLRLLDTQRFSRHGLWPDSAEEILPRGPRESMTALLFWLNHCRMDAVVPAFECIFVVCRPELMPQLLLDSQRALFVDTICRYVDWAVSALRTLRYPHHAHPIDIPAPTDLILCVAKLLHTINSGLGSEGDSLVRVVRGMEDRVLRSLDNAFCAVDDPEARSCIAISLDSIRLCTRLRLPEYMDAHLAAHRPENPSPYMELHGMLRFIARRVVCCAPACSTHQHQLGPGKRLLRCAACGIYQYCSRECQKRHWTAQWMPHKEVCRDLRDLCQKAPHTLSASSFTAALAGTQWDECHCNAIMEHLAIDQTRGECAIVSFCRAGHEQLEEQIARYLGVSHE